MQSLTRLTRLTAVCLNQLQCRSSLVRYMSAQEEYKKRYDYDLPPLMKFVPKPMPNIFYTLKNHFLVHFYLKPMVDKQFSIRDFMGGAKQALHVISTNLANDNAENIKDMVTPEAYEEITENLKQYDDNQKRCLAVEVEDILISFPYTIDIIKQKGSDTTEVKILVVFDVLRDFKQLLSAEAMFDKDRRDKMKFFDFNKYLEQKVLCNYEFIRKYVKGVSSDWVVSKLLHVKDKDILKMYGVVKK